MGTSLLSIGITGLNAAQAGLVTTGHNISNQATPGYSRQNVIQSANPALYGGTAGFYGQGVSVDTVKRAYNQYLGGQVLTADTRFQELQTYAEQMGQVNNLLGDTTAGLPPALQGFFSGVQAVADPSNTSSNAARQSMMSQGQALASTFQSLYGRLNELRGLTSTEINSSVDTINDAAKQIGLLNQQIVFAGNLGAGTPNDLLDARDALVAQLNQQVRVTQLQNDDGSVNIFIGNGQPLVLKDQVNQLTTGPSGHDVSKLTVSIVMPNGTQELPETAISGGQLSGLLSFRSQGIDTAQNSLGRIAIALTDTFNAQNRLGLDLNGKFGGDIFKPLSGQTVYPNQPKNTGTAQISVPITDASSLTTSDYSLTYSVANIFQLVRRSDGQAWTATGTDASDALAKVLVNAPNQGFSLNMSGTPNVGDSFLIEPTRLGAANFDLALTDPSQIAAAAPIATAAANTNTGTGKIDPGSVSSVANLTGSTPALSLPVNLTFSGGALTGFPTGFDVTVTQPDGTNTVYPKPATSVSYANGAKIDFAGVSFSIQGQPANGDSFSVQANTNAVGDNRNAVELGKLQQAKTIGGTASYESSYAQLVSQIGTQTRTAQVSAAAQQSVLQQATDARDSYSGVNLDEEAANLIRYQQAYQASGKVMEVASKLFDTILSIVNR